MSLDVIECLLLATAISGISFIIYQVLGTQIILVASTVLLTLACLCLRRWRKIREKGNDHLTEGSLVFLDPRQGLSYLNAPFWISSGT